MSKATMYAKRAGFGVFVLTFGQSLLDFSPYSPLANTSPELRIAGAVFLALILALVTAAIGAVIGGFLDRPTAHAQTTLIPKAQFEAPIPPVANVRTQTTDSSSEPDEDEVLWAAALKEFESNARRPGLWAKVFSESLGNEAAAKAAYLRLRRDELLSQQIAPCPTRAASSERSGPRQAYGPSGSSGDA